MVETRKVHKPTSIRCVTGTRYLEIIPEVQVCRSSVVTNYPLNLKCI